MHIFTSGILNYVPMSVTKACTSLHTMQRGSPRAELHPQLVKHTVQLVHERLIPEAKHGQRKGQVLFVSG